MKRIKDLTRLKLPKMVKRMLVFVLFLLVFDVLLADFGATYLSETTGFFFQKSFNFILSDFLFLEGGIAFSIGAFLEFAQSFSSTRPSDKSVKEQTTNRKRLREMFLRPGTFMMIVGAGFIGLSVMIGILSV